MEHRQTDFVIQFGFENWIIKSFCLCSTTDGTFFAQPLSLASTYLIGQKMWVPPCPMPVFHRQNAQDGSSCCCQMDLPQLQRQQEHQKGSNKWHSHHITSLNLENLALIHNVKFYTWGRSLPDWPFPSVLSCETRPDLSVCSWYSSRMANLGVPW